MASKRKGRFVTHSGIWAKHLRPWGKRSFWRRERRAARQHLQSVAIAMVHDVQIKGPAASFIVRDY